ncbi:hypothetical protein ASPWEDRAFT_104935 [Aspergillus wentii DTO 134E9]|uniref:Altered inheritance of mitochondria protein 21 n=1 Tax=Aspergillus wentii DTO 134E9 TaxID=1073089 RepID=A0A1L9RWE1_ASPWE|nr:uncharacterized protein ASPWEDRAFT_104935 [Aspergillus wentii DTO 134E9]OJJ39194.1 hypothetical protein ASPWEDRAFT_104935 [Aspergillus wentii DTO 134E9]
MTTQAPAIPPRPSRSPQHQGLAPTSSTEVPKMPPRPNRRVDRSVSPLPQNYAPSPLNELPNSSGLSRTTSNDLPPRPPSVTIPSLGQEGIEYEDLDVQNVDSHNPAPETRNVGSDLKIHAPRPSLPTSSAKAQVQAVTRTDSRQAAAAGLGVGSPAFDEGSDRASRSPHKSSGSRAESSAASSTRQLSVLDDARGPPEIGQRVPMYRNAGDVQAPSPSPYQLEHGSQRHGRSHNRTRSGREASLPPGSYGLHGHGVQPDKFDKAWYEKHPDEFVKEEQGKYGPGVGTPRPDWALSSDDLNKIVRGSAVTGSGLGTSPAVAGTPEEEVGYIASDEYSRHNSHPPAESSLRKSSVPSEEPTTQEEGPEKAGVIHVDDPYHPLHHPDGFAPAPDPEEQADGAEEGGVDDEEPILAADEVRPESAFQHAAVSPTFERRESYDHDSRSRTPNGNHSRSNSRSTSHHGKPILARFSSYNDDREDNHTPLENVEEYEPLFPEDDKKGKPVSTAERFKKRPDMLKHRFPSQDIWEDSPNSLQLHATVSTPDEPKQETFETPEQESFRKSQVAPIDAHQVASHILESEEQDKTSKRPEISKQRFPSRDIWEDAPDSQQLVTTIEPSEENEVKSPDVPSKPAIPSRPQRLSQIVPSVNASTKPSISPTEKKQPPVIPDRPKPQIPARPAKPISRGSAEEAKDAPAKAKPAVPARPGGSKIAALKAGFLTDLNSRLQLGPHAPPKPEKKEEKPPAEKAPLSDARKGRARGPARRKPAAEPAAQPAAQPVAAKLPTIPEIKIAGTWNVWEIREDGHLIVGNEDRQADMKEPTPSDASPVAETSMAPEISKNIAGEPTDPKPTTPAPDDVVSPTSKPVVVEETKPPNIKSPQSTSESELDEAIENLSASADGKRLSDGDVHND